MVGEFREDLEPTVILAENAILEIVRKIIPAARLNRIGPIDLRGPHWSCWVITDTDEERDLLERDQQLRSELMNAAAKVGFAPTGLVFQSQETVDNGYEGSWFYAMR